jgi:hypothetical protein
VSPIIIWCRSNSHDLPDSSQYPSISNYWWWDDPFYAMMEDRCASLIH